ncbi:MAG: hypothetical protein FJY43_08065 [Betaproteobacteria bacterium]|nr:hypothetical protein [Betaproteobacteria bacterium]
MRERLLILAETRARLSAHAQIERERLAAQLAPLDAAAAFGARLVHAARRAADSARHHPLPLTAGVALLVVLRPRRAAAWLARGWSLWRFYRGASGLWQRFAASAGARPTRAS